MRLNQISVNMLLICSLIDSVAKLWVNFLCLEYEAIENLSSMIFGSAIVLITIPLFLDLVYILVQRLDSGALSSLLQNEMRSF